MAKLHSDKYQVISINGAEYRADERGVFDDVPEVVVGSLIADYGMRTWAEPDAPPVTPTVTPTSPGNEGGDDDEDDVDDDDEGEGNADAGKKPVNYDKLNTAELLAEAARLGVDPTGMNVKKLRAAVKAVAASTTVSQKGDQ
jgi:hypothetical protein